MRRAIALLLRSAGHTVEECASPSDLLERYDPDRPGCLLFDFQLPEMNGLELWETLRKRGFWHPLIVVSGHCDVSTAVASIHLGALDFIEKPFDHTRLLEKIDLALSRDAEERNRRRQDAEFQALLDTLTRREREVMELVAEGLLTKQIARKLGISEKTVEVHRSHVTKKLRVQSVAQLVRLLTQRSLESHQPVVLAD